jgi:hypothetical protein
MAYLEEILPQIRAGRKAKRKTWGNPCFMRMTESGIIVVFDGVSRAFTGIEINADDWELVPEPVRVADYLVRSAVLLYGQDVLYIKKTCPIGQQPEGSVMVPGSEREQE